MEFYQQYNEFSKLSIKCGYLDTFINIEGIYNGSGGSNNVIIIGKLKYNGKMIAIKIIPFIKKDPNMILRNPRDQNEILFYNILTKNVILKMITPHIVGMYKTRHCYDIRNILPNTCLTLEETLFKKEEPQNILLCNLYRLLSDYYIEKQFDILLLEYCPVSLTAKLFEIAKLPTSQIISFLDRLLFQIIFTLAQLYLLYPDFQHGDLFIRNILGNEINNYTKNDYFEYVYNDNKFYFPVNGYQSKITDFGLSRLDNLILTKYFNNPKSKKIDYLSDIFNFLHDLYFGQNLGTISLMLLLNNKKRLKIRNYLRNFINVNALDQFNNNNKFNFDNIWNIASYKYIQEATNIKSPKDYLSFFTTKYSKIPKNANIIATFGNKN